MYRFTFSSFIPLISMLASFSSFSATVAMAIDNDSIVGSDREYTSGLFMRWADEVNRFNYSLELGSQMWTPSNIAYWTPQPMERPYAGLLYLQSRLNKQEQDYAIKSGLMLGTVGPRSHAEQSQKLVHEIIGSTEPMGWDYQIDNKWVYQFSMEGQQLLFREKKLELSGFMRGQLGNFQNEVAIGGTFRLGIGLDNSFGATSMTFNNIVDVGMLQQSRKGGFFFLGSEIRRRFTDITIEGDKPPENTNVDIKTIQAAIATGIVLYDEHWGISGSIIWQTKQYISPSARNFSYGNLTVFYRY